MSNRNFHVYVLYHEEVLLLKSINKCNRFVRIWYILHPLKFLDAQGMPFYINGKQ